MIFKLVDFALVILYLLMFKFCGNIGISKIVFFSFSGTKRVKQNKKKIKAIQKLLSLSGNFASNSNKKPNICWFFTENLTLWLPVPAGRIVIPT